MSTAPPTSNAYTALQQDRQARNRPTHMAAAAGASSSSSSSSSAAASRALAAARDETFEERERRYNAARILESNEMLIWHSVARNESLPQTRLHFEKIVAGFDSSDSEPEWEDQPSGPSPTTMKPASPGGADGDGRRGESGSGSRSGSSGARDSPGRNGGRRGRMSTG